MTARVRNFSKPERSGSSATAVKILEHKEMERFLVPGDSDAP